MYTHIYIYIYIYWSFTCLFVDILTHCLRGREVVGQAVCNCGLAL